MRGVLYVAYGSNLDLDRFRCYLLGGTAEGALRSNPGSRDRAGWGLTFSAYTRHQVYFAGRSATWGGGGMAFLRVEPQDPVRTPVRVYLISGVQFEDLVAQENGRVPGSVEIDLEPLGLPGIHAGDWGLYDTIVSWGTGISDWPIVTVTTGRALSPSRPSAVYLRTVARGLRHTHGLSDPELNEYLGGLEGMDPDGAQLREVT